MLITWVLIITLMGVCVKIYSEHLPSTLESKVKDIKIENQRKINLRVSLQSSMKLNEEAQKQRIGHPQTILSEKQDREESCVSNQIGHFRKDRAIRPKVSKVSFLSSVMGNTESQKKLPKSIREILPNMHHTKKRFDRDTFKNSPNTRMTASNLKDSSSKANEEFQNTYLSVDQQDQLVSTISTTISNFENGKTKLVIIEITFI